MSFVTTRDGTRLRTSDRGSGPAVVLVHGWKMSHRIWDRTVVGLEDRYRVVSFDLRNGGEAARQFSERLTLFALTASLGSTESLVMAPQLIGTRDFTAEQARQSGIGPGTVRLSIGLEDVGDLVSDIEQALASLGAD